MADGLTTPSLAGVEPILRAAAERQAAVAIYGRDTADLILDGEGRLRPLLEVGRRELRTRFGLALITYSRAQGVDFAESALGADGRAVRNILQRHGLTDLPAGTDEVVAFFRGLASLLRDPLDGITWSDGRPLHIAALISFAEHLLPRPFASGTQTDEQIAAVELVHLASRSEAVRSSGNMVLFHAREGLLDDLLDLHEVRLPQPDFDEKLRFIEASMAAPYYTRAQFTAGLDARAVARITKGTPNRGVEALLRASHFGGEALDGRTLAARRRDDVITLSEGTLAPVDTDGADAIELTGRNIEVPLNVVLAFARGIANGDAKVPPNVLLCGAPGTAKSQLMKLAVHRSQLPGFTMLSGKSSFVGESERRGRLQWRVLGEVGAAVATVDELTEMMPTQRNDWDGDNGATRSQLGAWLEALADPARRGRSLLLAASNVPERMGAAYAERWCVIPVLMPVLEDYAAVVVTLCRRVEARWQLHEDDSTVREAARLFHQKGVSPRRMVEHLSQTCLDGGTFDAGTALRAARLAIDTADRRSFAFAELSAISLTLKVDYLPWHGDPGNYPFPEHLDGLVSTTTGEPDMEAIRRRMAELAPYANV